MNTRKPTKITQVAICGIATALAIGAILHNPGHLVTAAIIFAVGLNVEWKEREDVI